MATKISEIPHALFGKFALRRQEKKRLTPGYGGGIFKE